jgi:hypothetical protein
MLSAMQTLRLLPVVLSTLALAAHLFRAGLPLGFAALVAGAPLALVGGRRAAVLAVQTVLALAAVEWLRTAAVLVAARRAAGEPHLRLALILFAVAALGAFAVWTVESWRGHRRVPVTSSALHEKAA